MFLYSITFMGRVGKPQRSRKKEEKEIIEKGFLYQLLLPSHPFYCFIYFSFLNLFIYLFIFGCVGSSFLCEGFL